MRSGSLLRRILVERRRVLVPLAVLAVANLAVYVLLVYPLTLRVNSSEGRADAARERLRAAQREATDVAQIRTRTHDTDAQLAIFYDNVLPADLSGARRQTYARLDELARSHGLILERRTYAVDDAYKGRLKKLRIGMALSGEYEDVRDFMHALETSSEFVVIEDVALAEGSSPEGDLSLALQLATYFRADADGE
jgi:type IV pilus assembly protein PilO